MISVRSLSKRHGDRAVLVGVTAEVARGETIAIVGPSGGGKSTLLRCLNYLERFDAGEVAIAGVTLTPATPTSGPVLRALRTRVGMVFQQFHLFPHLTALDNIALAPRVVKRIARAAAHDRAQALRLALPPMTNDFVSLLKDSSLVSVITVIELTKRMTIAAVDLRGWLVPGLLCAGLYLMLSFPLSELARRLERRLARDQRPQAL